MQPGTILGNKQSNNKADWITTNTQIRFQLNTEYIHSVPTRRINCQEHVKIRQTKPYRSNVSNTPTRIKSADNIQIFEHVKIIKRWKEFYSNLYHSVRETFGYLEGDPDCPIPPVLSSEIEHCLKQLKSSKAPGPDGITSEMLSEGGAILPKQLQVLTNSTIKTRTIPDQFKLSEITTIFKKGDLLEYGNYRPISLLSHLYKLVIMIIYQRIKTPFTAALESPK